MRRTGFTVPSAFDTWATATIFVRGDSSRSNCSMTTWPSWSRGATRSFAPFSSHSICQGTMFEWCSSPVMRTSSPGPTLRRP